MPGQWNGALCVYSAGYGGSPDAGVDLAGDPLTARLLLEAGYALAGSRPPKIGWVVEESLRDQQETIAAFRSRVGTPSRTIAWGHSMGGLISAGMAQVAPDVIDGSVPMCASVAGPIPMLNQGLDAAFVFNTLVQPREPIPLDSSMRDEDRLALGIDAVRRATGMPAGRARIALAGAVAQLPAWSVDNLFAPKPDPSEPAAGDTLGVIENMARVLPYVAFSPRNDLESRAGGVFSWNAGVDYARQLETSGANDLVRAAYASASADVSLASDLALLDEAPRVTADPAAVAYMERNITPNGSIGVPVLTVSLTGDFAPTVTQTSAYADLVTASGCADLLRQVYVHGPGHCHSFSAAEVVAAIDAMDRRIVDGSWPELAPAGLNHAAEDVASRHWPRLKRPRFAEYAPAPFNRPYARHERGSI